MEINEIKRHLTIHQVLSHYGLKPDKNSRILCPFHEDKTPSMQAYPLTRTVYCFSIKCKLHGQAVDGIDFIMHKESISKHEALKKAIALISPGTEIELKPILPKEVEEKNLSEVMKGLSLNLRGSQPAKDYLQSRSLDS